MIRVQKNCKHKLFNSSRMLIKVCGVKLDEDLAAIASAGVDFVGLIFYPASARYAGGSIDKNLVELLAKTYPNLKRVGVFVNADREDVLINAESYHLNTLQFHGEETPEYCAQFKDRFSIIKALAIETEEDFGACEKYEGICDYFLFDTSGPLPGGNGYGWDWSLLSAYNGDTPFLLSGGIGPADILKICAIRHPRLTGIDINSKFEKIPGVKNCEAIKSFVRIIKAGEYEIYGE